MTISVFMAEDRKVQLILILQLHCMRVSKSNFIRQINKGFVLGTMLAKIMKISDGILRQKQILSLSGTNIGPGVGILLFPFGLVGGIVGVVFLKIAKRIY
jgi:hypothetical protein